MLGDVVNLEHVVYGLMVDPVYSSIYPFIVFIWSLDQVDWMWLK